MKFKCNNIEWTIKEISNAEMEEKYGVEDNFTQGITIYSKNTIYLNKDSVQIIRTLKHELTHVWLYEYGHYQEEKEFTNEDVCEIVASCNNFINEVVEQYMNKDKYNKNDDAIDIMIDVMKKELENRNKENILPC